MWGDILSSASYMDNDYGEAGLCLYRKLSTVYPVVNMKNSFNKTATVTLLISRSYTHADLRNIFSFP